MSERILISAIVGLGLAGCCFGGASDAGADFSLAPGFSPDPASGTGNAGGLTDASTLSSECRGYIAATPNHLLTATAAFPSLRIAINGGNTDVTLVVQRPDGSYLCNDDFEGLNPLVEAPFAAGEHRIYIGTYSAESAGARYRIGISELSSTSPNSIGTP